MTTSGSLPLTQADYGMLSIEEPLELAKVNFKPNYSVTFNKDGVQIGELDFNGPGMSFNGQAEESARLFFDWVAVYFAQRLSDERQKGRDGL